MTLTLADGRTFTGDELLVAVGRTPNSDDLGLEAVGLEPGEYVEVDDHLRAVGRRRRVAVRDRRRQRPRAPHPHGEVPGPHRRRRDHPRRRHAGVGGSPRVPRGGVHRPAAGVGRPHRAGGARARASTCGWCSYGTGDVAGAVLHGRGIKGTSQIVVDESRHVIVGATFTGPGVGELLHAATIAIAGEVPLETLVARRARVPDRQRSLAPAPRGLRPVTRT